MKYQITGGRKLEGKINISGNKNAIFPCLAAALLTEEEVVLYNISNLKDTQVLIKILENLGVNVKQTGSELSIKASNLRRYVLPDQLMGKLRGSIVLVGSILSRAGKVRFSHPGGDIIGRRNIDAHLNGFKALGVSIKKDNLNYSLTLEKREKNENIDIFLKEASVTATENLILLSVVGKQTVVLRNCAKEPHVLDLCRMLIQMGARISGTGTDILEIMGVERLFGTKYKIGIDFIEVGTYMIAACITGGRIQIGGIDGTDMNPICKNLEEFGIKIEMDSNNISVWADKLKSPAKITTNIWPGFPTDLMSVVMVLATQSKGIILCHDWMYESRMFFVDKLISMGANITLADPHRVLIYGPTKLKGRKLDTPDIRAGMALVLAGLVAKGKSVINQSDLIERGYENVVEKLKNLGAEIVRIND